MQISSVNIKSSFDITKEYQNIKKQFSNKIKKGENMSKFITPTVKQELPVLKGIVTDIMDLYQHLYQQFPKILNFSTLQKIGVIGAKVYFAGSKLSNEIGNLTIPHARKLVFELVVKRLLELYKVKLDTNDTNDYGITNLISFSQLSFDVLNTTIFTLKDGYQIEDTEVLLGLGPDIYMLREQFDQVKLEITDLYPDEIIELAEVYTDLITELILNLKK